jgi:hypothetical protein
MNYQILELPLDIGALALQQAINSQGETFVSIVADPINKRFIIVFSK